MQRALRVAHLLAAGTMAWPAAAAGPDEELAAFLAGTCAACHQPDLRESAIPGIAGLDEARFISLIQAYRSGARTDSVMQAVAASLSDAETAALARYLAAAGDRQ
jgi:cytochrome c553